MAVPLRFALAVVLLALFGAFTQPRAPADEPAKPAPKSRSLDSAKLPPNAVIIVSDNPRNALQNVDAVVLTPDEYKKLLEAAAEAKRLSTPDKPEPPSVCRLSGKIETRGAQEVAVLRAEFQFRTAVPRATVLLGLKKGKPVGATIDDGKLAMLVSLKDDEGFAVQVDAAGEHRAIIDLEAPVVSRGPKSGERAIELGLPGAAITVIENLALPPGVARARLGGRSYLAGRFTAGTEKAPAFLLGPAPKLDIAWDAPAAAAKIVAQTTVDGRYDVRVEDHALITRARLTIKAQSGAIGMWEIQAPPAAELTTEAEAPENVIQIQKPQANGKPWIVRRDPSGADLVLDLSVRTELAPGQSAAVPGFAVGGAVQQRGTITVGGPPHLRLAFEPGPGLTRREAGDAVAGVSDPGFSAAFSFFRLPESGSPLTIGAQPARGDVETHVAHQFTLAERGWRWQGKFDVRPVRTEVTWIDLEVPAELDDLRPASAEFVEAISPLHDAPGGRKIVRVQLAEARRKAFTFTLEGLFPIAASTSAATLSLPRPLGTIDRGGQIAATVPTGLDLRGSYREWEGDKTGEWEHPLDPAPRGAAGVAAAVERTPARLDLAWRAPRADVAITATADIQLGERQATVRHQWRVPAGPAAPRQFVARGPAALAGRLRAVDGGTVGSTSPGEWAVQLAAPAGREAVLTVTYSFPLPSGPERVVESVPLVWLEPCPRCETDVRIWSATIPNGVLVPTVADGPWTEMPPRAVPDRQTIPTLSLHGVGAHLPLGLRLAEAAAGPGTGLVVDRMWVQAMVDSEGQQSYRARCLIRPQQTHLLDVELPASPMASQFIAQLDGKRLPRTVTAGAAGQVVRLRLDPVESGRGPSVLDLSYQLPPAGPNKVGMAWKLMLSPPRLRGPVFVGPVRWQIGLASDDLLASRSDDVAFEWRWGWQRGLLAPRPAWTGAELARWFAADSRTADPADGSETAWVGWQSAAGSLQFLVVPRPLALLFGSLAVLAIGFAAARVGQTWRIIGAMTLTVGLAVLAIFRPQALALLLYTAQPGAAVLAVALSTRWALQRRYRRQVLFLPGPTRPSGSSAGSPNGSSMIRNGAANRVRREPTTIDAPAPPAFE